MKREEIVKVAREVIGTKWVHCGRCPINGLDCAGLLAYIMRRFDIPVVDDRKTYGLLSDGRSFREALERNLETIPADEIRIGSVVVFGIRGLCPPGEEPEYPQHAGVVCERDERCTRIIHASNARSHRRVLEQIVPPRWWPHLSFAMDFPGVDPE